MESSIFNIISHYYPYLPGILLSHQQAVAFLYLPHQDHGDGDSQQLKEPVGKECYAAYFMLKINFQANVLTPEGLAHGRTRRGNLNSESPLVKALPCRPTGATERVTGH